jgi:hypothetical protein
MLVVVINLLIVKRYNNLCFKPFQYLLGKFWEKIADKNNSIKKINEIHLIDLLF